MDRRRFLALSVTAGLGAVAGVPACESGGKGGAEQARKVMIGDIVDEGNPHVVSERFFARRFEELSDGRFKVEIRPRAVLGDHTRMNDLVRTGKLEMSKTFLGNLAMFDQRVQAISMPWAFTGTADMLAALDGAAGNSIKAKVEAADLLLMGFFNAGPRNVYNTLRPIRVPEDLRGMRVRVPQDMVSLDAFNACGARTIPLPFNDIISALRNRFIDAAENSVVFYVTTGHSELAKFWSLTRHQVGIDALIISKLWFGGLARRDRAALEQAAEETIPYERRLWLEKSEEYSRSIKDQGVAVNDDVDVAAFQTVVAPVVAKYRPALADLADLLPLV